MKDCAVCPCKQDKPAKSLMGLFAQPPLEVHAAQENINWAVLPQHLQASCGPLFWHWQWQATALNSLMNQANASLYPAQNTVEQSSLAPQDSKVLVLIAN